MMTKPSIREIFKGSTSQIFTSLLVSITSISNGMHYGWTSPYIPILKSEESKIKISQSDETRLESLLLIAGIVSLPLSIYMVDKIGRRKAIMLGSFLDLAAWSLKGLAFSVYCLHIAQFVAGVGSAITCTAAPMYVVEIAGPKVRGFLSSISSIMLLIGVFLIYTIAPYVSFIVPSIFGSVLLIVQLIGCLFITESPYFLIYQNKIDEAKRSLKKLRCSENDNEIEFEEISSSVRRTKREYEGIKSLIKDPSNRKVFFIIFMLLAIDGFSGLAVFLMNFHEIFMEAGSMYLDFNLIGILFSFLLIIFSISSSLFVDKYGRKRLLFISCCLTSIDLLILAIYFNLKRFGYDLQSISFIPLACVLSYTFAYELGLGIMPLIVTAEILSNNVKAVGLGFFSVILFGFGFVTVEFYQLSKNVWGICFPLYVFAVLTFCGAIFFRWYLPETKGKTLGEIQILLKR